MNVYNFLAVEHAIQKLDTMQKLDNFIGLCTHFHSSRCENVDCSQCDFISKLRICWIKHSVLPGDAVYALQQYCRLECKHSDYARINIQRLAKFKAQRFTLRKI